jgi:hypothetical protein
MLADAEAYGNQFPAYRENPMRETLRAVEGLAAYRATPGDMGNFGGLWFTEARSSTKRVLGPSWSCLTGRLTGESRSGKWGSISTAA